jgi:hypothetical protein
MTQRALTFLIALAGVSWTGPAAAQGLGLGGGLNLAKLTGQDQTLIRSKERKGLNLGGTFNFQVYGPVSLQPEVYYAQKGQVQESADASATLRMDYLEVPVLARITLPGTSFLTPHITGGPALAWNLRCDLQVETEVTDGGASDCDNNPFARQFGKADRGLVLGGGVRLALGPVGMVVDARMVRGLERLEQDTTEGETKNQALSFLVRFNFGGM